MDGKIKKFRQDLKEKNWDVASKFIQEQNKNPDFEKFSTLLPNQPDEENEMTLLMHVVFSKNLDLTKQILAPFMKEPVLLKKIINFTIHINKYTPLMMACISGQEQIVKFLMEHGADREAKSSINKTAIDLAAFIGQSEIAGYLSNYFDSEKIKCQFTKNLLSETNLAPANVALNHFDNADSHKMYKIKENLMEVFHNEPFPINAKAAYLYQIIERIEKCQLPNVLNKETGVLNIKNYIRLHAVSANVYGAKPFQHQEIVAAVAKLAEKHKDFEEVLKSVSNITEASYMESSLRTIEDFLCGMKSRSQDDRCDLCCKANAKFECGGGCGIKYCCQKCQKLSWFDHKKWCLGIRTMIEEAAERAKQEKEGKIAKKQVDINEVQQGLAGTKLSKTGFDVD